MNIYIYMYDMSIVCIFISSLCTVFCTSTCIIISETMPLIVNVSSGYTMTHVVPWALKFGRITPLNCHQNPEDLGYLSGKKPLISTCLEVQFRLYVDDIYIYTTNIHNCRLISQLMRVKIPWHPQLHPPSYPWLSPTLYRLW
jgi:hypothetical protein